jgi:hypothetical protein
MSYSRREVLEKLRERLRLEAILTVIPDYKNGDHVPDALSENLDDAEDGLETEANGFAEVVANEAYIAALTAKYGELFRARFPALAAERKE